MENRRYRINPEKLNTREGRIKAVLNLLADISQFVPECENVFSKFGSENDAEDIQLEARKADKLRKKSTIPSQVCAFPTINIFYSRLIDLNDNEVFKNVAAFNECWSSALAEASKKSKAVTALLAKYGISSSVVESGRTMEQTRQQLIAVGGTQNPLPAIVIDLDQPNLCEKIFALWEKEIVERQIEYMRTKAPEDISRRIDGLMDAVLMIDPTGQKAVDVEFSRNYLSKVIAELTDQARRVQIGRNAFRNIARKGSNPGAGEREL